ncbi:E3 ubiquitin-protein ligase FANCL-like, partial [Tropilaelaps mercedesae]
MNDSDAEANLLARKEMLHRFPSFVPTKADLSEFRGWLRLCGRSVLVDVRCHSGNQEIAVTSSNGLLQSLLKELKADAPELLEKIQHMHQPAAYLCELVNALNR